MYNFCCAFLPKIAIFLLWCSPFPRSQTVLYIAQDDLKERYKNKTERIKRYCASTKTIGSTTHLQVRVNEQQNGTIRIKVEAYPLKSLAKAVQYLIEEFCEVIILRSQTANWLTHCMMTFGCLAWPMLTRIHIITMHKSAEIPHSVR